MSYDIWLTMDTGGPEPAMVCEVGNYTSNVSPMWSFALGFSLSDLDGCSAGECVADLERAYAHMRDPQHAATYAAMQPANGWGDLMGARAYLAGLLAACRAHPKAQVRIWR